MEDSRTSNVIKNSGASLLSRLVQMFVQFVIRTIFIYYLGNEYTGISGLFTDIIQVLSLLELGLDTSMIYSLYNPIAQNDTRHISALMNFYRKAFNVIGIVVLTAGVVCTSFLGYIVKGVPNISEDIRGIFLMYVATTSFSYFLVYKTIILRANQKSRIISNWTSVVYILESVLESVLIIIFRKFYAYLIVHFIATIMRNVILSWETNKLYPEYVAKTDETLSKQEKIKLFRDLACLTMYSTAGVVIYSTDSVFISAFLGTIEVAIIGNFTLIINAVRKMVEQVVGATKPSIGNLAATSNTEKQELVFKRMNFISFWVACFTGTCLFVLLNPFVGDVWFDASYKLPIASVAILIANYFIAVMVYPVESFRTANGLFVQGWMRPLIMAVTNIVLDFVMGRLWGLDGILLATTISRLATQVWYDPYLIYKLVFKKKSKQYFIDYLIYVGITILSCGVTLFLCGIFSTSKVIDFIISMVLSVIVPNVIIYLLFHKTDEYQFLISMVGRLKNKLNKSH